MQPYEPEAASFVTNKESRSACARPIAQVYGVDPLVCPRCSAPIGLKEVHFDAWLTLAARNLCLTEEKGLDVVTLGSGCTNTSRETNHILAQDEKKRPFVHYLQRRLGKEYRGNMKIYHLPDRLAQEEILARLAERRVRSLDGLKVGTYCLCHYIRPA